MATFAPWSEISTSGHTVSSCSGERRPRKLSVARGGSATLTETVELLEWRPQHDDSLDREEAYYTPHTGHSVRRLPTTHITTLAELWRAEASKTLCRERRPDNDRRNGRALGVEASAWWLSRSRGGLRHSTCWQAEALKTLSSERRLHLQGPFWREEHDNDSLCPQSKLQELPCSITRACSGPTVWEKPRWKWWRSAKLLLQCAGPHGDASGSSFQAANGLLREPVSRNWSLECLELLVRCPGAEDQQEMAEPAALETPEGGVSLSVPLRFWAEETERSAHWRPLRPGTLAGLKHQSPVFFIFAI